MQRKITGLLAALTIVLWAMSAVAATAPKYGTAYLHVPPAAVADESFVSTSAGSPRSFGTRYSVGTSTIPGTVVGNTYYDWQHNGSTGRQVDKTGNTIQVTFMDQNSPQIAPGRLVAWNKVAVTGSPATITLDNGASTKVLPLGIPATAEGAPFIEDQAGYTTFRARPNGKGVAFYHAVGATGTWTAQVDGSPGNGIFGGNPAPQPSGAQYNADSLVIWPHGTTSVACGDTNIHVVSTWQGDATEVWYWHGTITGATTIAWDAPVLMDSAYFINAVVEAQGDNVAVVYSEPIDNWDLSDVMYRLSTDCGATWGPPTSISNYSTTSSEGAWLDLAAVFDPSGVLHVSWNTWHYDTATALYSVIPCNLNHWNSTRNTTRVITSGNWENFAPDGCSGRGLNGMGSNNLILCKMNLAVKPAGVYGISDELLYSIWVQGGPTTSAGDCATEDSTTTPGGGVNTELYCSVSSDDGFTWDRPSNLTGTVTPDCQPGDCHSEHWVSVAARADSGVYLSYTDDTHAGGTALTTGPQGEWSLSPYRVMAAEARPPVIAPVISVGPVLDFDELHVKPESTKSVLISISNLGNAPLNYDVDVTNDDGGLSHVEANGGPTASGSIAAAGAPQILTISYDGVGLANPSERNWRLEVTSNDSLNNPGVGGAAIDVSLNVFIADPWFTCVHDTISTGQHRMAVGSCLELGDQGDGGGLFKYSDSSEWVFDASPVVARLDGATKRSHVDVHLDGVADRSRDTNKAYRAQSAISTFRTGSADSARGVAYTTDSLIQLDYVVKAFKSPGLNSGVIARYTVTNISGSSISGIHLGAASDLDVDSSSGANDGIASSVKQYIGARGGYLDSAGGTFFPQNNYGALFYQALDGACTDVAAGGQVLNNVDYLYPDGKYNSDSLYDWMNEIIAWGSATISADTPTDVNVVLVNKKSVTLANNASTQFAFGFAVSDVSIADLEQKIGALREAANPACQVCPITVTGDVNGSNTITSADIIYLVGYVFKGGPQPQPCIAAGDVNCSGTVTSADIIYLVGYVFKGGAAPCDACTSAAPC
jgi:hypothetical protein